MMSIQDPSIPKGFESSVTDYDRAVRVALWIKYCKDLTGDRSQPGRIVELTAGVGGNTTVFAEYFSHVEAVELNPVNYSSLLINLQKAEVMDRVKTHSANAVTYVERMESFPPGTIVYYDPPWGGVDYKKASVIPDLKIANRNTTWGIKDVIRNVKEKKAGYICLKLPYNIDQNLFTEYKHRYTMILGNILHVFIPLS